MIAAGFDLADFEHILIVELGRETFATNARMVRIIREVVESDASRNILNDHDGSEFGQWKALYRRYPEQLRVRVEDALGYAGHSLSLRLNREAFEAWPASVTRSVRRAAEKVGYELAA